MRLPFKGVELTPTFPILGAGPKVVGTPKSTSFGSVKVY